MFDMSVIVIRFSFLLIPGIIGTYIFSLLTGRKSNKDFDNFIEVFLVSIFSYFIYGLILNIKNKPNIILELLFDESKKIIFSDIFSDILFTTIIALIISIILTILYNFNIINKIAQFFKISVRYGSHDLWDYFHRDKNNNWICVRDHKTKLIYYGYVVAFSENKEKRELIMGDITVYSDIINNKKDNKLYDLKYVYFSRDDFDLTIEIANNEFKEINNGKRRS